MQITKTHKIVLSIVALIVLLGFYIFFDMKARKDLNNELLDANKTATTTNIVNNSNTSGVTYKIENVKNEKVSQIPRPIPDLDRSLTRSSIAMNISDNDFLVSTARVKELQSVLKKNPLDFETWMDLAMYQKLGGDYDGALESWKYAGKVAPKDFVSVANMANLYAYFIKDNAQAEVYYLEAIKKAPTQSYLYTQLAEVYRDIFKSVDRAKAIVEQGLKNIPNDPVLLEFRDSLK